MHYQNRRWADWGLLALRLVVGFIFIYHGSLKWAMWSAAPASMSAGMVNLFRFLAIVEPLGGLALVLGFLTRWASLGLGLIMLGAIYFKVGVMGVAFIAQKGTGWEFDLTLLAANLALLTGGAGWKSLDAMWLSKNLETESCCADGSGCASGSSCSSDASCDSSCDDKVGCGGACGGNCQCGAQAQDEKSASAEKEGCCGGSCGCGHEEAGK